MSTGQRQPAPSRKPGKPFYFKTSEHLLRIGRERAGTLPELLDALRQCPDDSIFQHTFRTLQEHHFIRQGFSNDFAHWSLFACHEPILAEQLASVDVREFTSIEGLRRQMVEMTDEFLKERPRAGSRTAHEPFYFAPPTSLFCRRRLLPTRFRVLWKVCGKSASILSITTSLRLACVYG